MNACTACGRRSATARVESTHRTSEGVVRYLRCACGKRWVEQARLVVVTGWGLVRRRGAGYGAA
jgi:hypothetical protein